MNYLVDVYEKFYLFFLFGWVVYIVAAICGFVWLHDLKSNDPHKGQKRYYGIIAIASFLIIGVLGSIFLPSPELVTAWLS